MKGITPTVILVDSDAALRCVSAQLFESAGFEVVELTLDELALDVANFACADVIVVSLASPVKTDGFEWLLYHERIVRAPVVALISGVGIQNEEELESLDIELILRKPVPFPRLLEAVQQLICVGSET